jgi:hypothetical protein
MPGGIAMKNELGRVLFTILIRVKNTEDADRQIDALYQYGSVPSVLKTDDPNEVEYEVECVYVDEAHIQDIKADLQSISKVQGWRITA